MTTTRPAAHPATPGKRVASAPHGNVRKVDRRLCVAPMMAHTDRHFRFLLRLISKHVMLYTEMVTSAAVLRGARDRFLAFDPAEHPIGIQFGGGDPSALAQCAHIAAEMGYDEVNLNVGCPSERVSQGCFGASLMAEPDRVADCVAAMAAACPLPVTVKTRTGIDSRDSYGDLAQFISTVAAAGCRTFILHARKAWLKGLSPAQNRSVPPLRHDMVYRVKAEFPALQIITNGGIESLEAAREHLDKVDGVMMGRAVYRDPYLLAAADHDVFGVMDRPPGRDEVLERYADYAADAVRRGEAHQRLARALLGMFQGQRGARAFRRRLSEGWRNARDPEFIRASLRPDAGNAGYTLHEPGRATFPA